MKSFFKILLILIALAFLIIINTKRTPYYDKVFKIIDTLFPVSLSSSLRMIANNKMNSKRIKNDYNIKFLPDTMYNKMEFKKIPLDFIKISNVRYIDIIKRKAFYIDLYDDYLVVMPKNGTFYYQNITNIEKNNTDFKKIDSNLNADYVLDLLVKDKKIYVSYVIKKDKCHFLYLGKSDINLEKLKFEVIFSSKKCTKIIASGRIQKIIKDNSSYILLATNADVFKKEDERDYEAQDDSSIYGKILAINEKNNSYKIFSKGHRNILGLHVEGDVILSTENGPRGADEINRIYENKNYGWDIASYGKKYKLDEAYKNHRDFGFEEPIFSFIPGVGISEIVKIDNNFDEDWQNNYLVATMYDKHLIRVKFNHDFKKIDYYEKIFIGERMRDLKYFDKKSMIIMALEDTGSLGILTDVDNSSQKQ